MGPGDSAPRPPHDPVQQATDPTGTLAPGRVADRLGEALHGDVSSALVNQSAPVGATGVYPEGAGPGGSPRARRGIRLSVHLGLALALAVGAVAYATVLRPVPPARQPVLIEDLAVADLGGRRLDVTITVVNEHREPKTARVWWLLAVPGGGPEWDRRAYRSSVTSLELAPGQQAALPWHDDAQVPPGVYTISAWVHVEGDTGFIHEDGRLGDLVDIEPAAGTRARQPCSVPPRPDSASGSTASPRPCSRARPATASAVVHNPSDEVHRMLLRWGVFAVVENVPSDWWREPAVWWGTPLAVDLEPGETREVTLGDVGVTVPGRYGVRVLLDPTARETGGPFDDVAVATPLQVGG